MASLADLSFDDWIEHAFGREVRLHGNAWYFDPDAPWWDPPPRLAIDYLTRLFDEPEKPLAWFSDAQIAQGMTYLLNSCATGERGWLISREVPVAARRRCIMAIHTLFAALFAPRCAPVLGHLDEAGARPINGVTYMFWDVFPGVALSDDPDRDVLVRATLSVMTETLRLESIACQESALHGLGHAHRDYPDIVEGAIDGFLATHPVIRPELAAYARAARCGCVL